MSLIGPRPLLVKYLPYYNNEERLRHNVRPGLSGLAQVNGRNAISWEEKFKFDVMYVKKVTFIGDVKIILETVKKAFIKSEGITLNALEDFDEYRKKSSKNPYFIPGGGHGNIGTEAYFQCYEEIKKYEEINKIFFDYIFFASGTGTTHAGLVCGQIKNNDEKYNRKSRCIFNSKELTTIPYYLCFFCSCKI